MMTHGPDGIAPSIVGGPADAPPGAGPTSVHCSAQTTPRFRVVYALPKDATDRSATRVTEIRELVESAGQVVRNRANELAPGRDAKIRVACNQANRIDVQVVRLPTAGASDSFSTVSRDLTALGYLTTGENTLAYLEGAVAAGVGGQAALPGDSSQSWSNAANAGGSLAVIYNSALTSWHVTLHELSHTLNAVTNAAPNSSKAGHCIDGLDVMCYADGGARSSLYSGGICATVQYDCNADDYFHPAPAAGSYLDSNVNLAKPQNQFFRHTAASDTTAPTISVSAPASNGVRARQITFTGTENIGLERVEISVDGVAHSVLGVLPATFSLAGISAGSHLIEAVAVDTAGNRSAKAARTVIVDTTGPAITLGTVPVTTADSITLNPGASDDAGVESVRAYINASVFLIDTSAPYQFTIPTDKLPAGPASWRVVAIDGLGNSSEVTATSTISRGTGLTAAWYDDETWTTFQVANSGIGPISLVWGGNGGGTATSKVSGDTWSAKFHGKVRMPEAQPVQFRITADDYASLTINGMKVAETTGTGLQSATSTAQTFSAGALQDLRLAYMEMTGSAMLLLEWKIGSSYWTTIPKVHLFPDTTVPTVSLTAPAASAVVSDTTLITATAADDLPVKSVEFRIDDLVVATDTSAPFEYPWNTLTTPRGNHTITAIAIDQSGNTSTAATRTVMVDNGTGLVAKYYDDDALTQLSAIRIDKSINFSWGTGAPTTKMNPDTFSVRWDGELRIPASGPIPELVLNYDDGVRMWINNQQVVDSWDSGGSQSYSANFSLGQRVPIRIEYRELTGSAAMQLQWKIGDANPVVIPTKNLYIERTGPTVSVASPAASTTIMRATKVTAAATDVSGIAKVDFMVDDRVIASDMTAPYEFDWNPAGTLNGSRALRMRATDFAANVATSAPVTVSVDVGTGLRGACWNETDLATSPAASEVLAATLNMVNVNPAPCANVEADTWSVRFKGSIRIPSTDPWTLLIRSDDGLKVTVGGVVAVNELTYSGVSRDRWVSIPAGAADRKVPVVIEKTDVSGTSELVLRWTSVAQPAALVPAAMLFPATSALT